MTGIPRRLGALADRALRALVPVAEGSASCWNESWCEARSDCPSGKRRHYFTGMCTFYWGDCCKVGES